MNLRPSGYEPDELPDCSIPRYPIFVLDFSSKADDRTRTDNLLITNQLLCQLSHIGRLPDWQVGGGGFEPPKQFAADLQSVPFGHSGICPFIRNVLTGIYYSIVNFNVQALFITMFSGNTRAPAPLSLSFPDRTCGYFPAPFPPAHSRTVRPYDGISWQWSAPYVSPVHFHRRVCP